LRFQNIINFDKFFYLKRTILSKVIFIVNKFLLKFLMVIIQIPFCHSALFSKQDRF